MRYLIAACLSLGLIFGGSAGAKAYHVEYSHTLVLCMNLIDILTISEQLPISSQLPAVTGPCRPFNAMLGTGDVDNMAPLAGPAQDVDGDWYAPFSVSTKNGMRYVILYSGKGNSDFAPVPNGVTPGNPPPAKEQVSHRHV